MIQQKYIFSLIFSLFLSNHQIVSMYRNEHRQLKLLKENNEAAIQIITLCTTKTETLKELLSSCDKICSAHTLLKQTNAEAAKQIDIEKFEKIQ